MGSAILCLALTSSVASANPGAEPGPLFNNAGEALVTIFLYNLPVDLLWFGVALLILCALLGDRIGVTERRRSRFLVLIVVTATVICAFGTLIDFALLLEEFPFGYVLYYDALNWIVAVFLIFASIFFSALLFLRLNLRASLVPAAAMALLNPVWWTLERETVENVTLLTIAICLVLLPLVFALLWRVHAKMSGSATTSQKGAASS